MKFKVGEACYARSLAGWFQGKKDCVIIAQGNPFGISPDKESDYTILIHGFPNKCRQDGYWVTLENRLIKKRPPQQDDNACDESWIDMKNRFNTELVEEA